MKKPMEQLKEIMGVPAEQPAVDGTSKELREVKRQINLFIKLIKISFGIEILIIGLLIIGCVGVVLDHAITQNIYTDLEIYKIIQGIIVSSAILYMTVVCMKFCENIIQSSTPFIPQVPKGLRKIAAAIAVMLLLSIAASGVYSAVTGAEFILSIDATGWAFVFILMLLSSIFDYGCKLQQESDETI